MIKYLIISNNIQKNKKRKSKKLKTNRLKILKKWWRNKRFWINNKKLGKKIKAFLKNNLISLILTYNQYKMIQLIRMKMRRKKNL